MALVVTARKSRRQAPFAVSSMAYSMARLRCSSARRLKYQAQKVRHYRNRCREMGITPDETLIEQILDPEIDFVVGVEAG